MQKRTVKTVVLRWFRCYNILLQSRQQNAQRYQVRIQEAKELRRASDWLRTRRVPSLAEKRASRIKRIWLQSPPAGELVEITTLVEASTFRNLHSEARAALGIARRASPISLRLTFATRMGLTRTDEQFEHGDVIPCNDKRCEPLFGSILTAMQSR